MVIHDKESNSNIPASSLHQNATEIPPADAENGMSTSQRRELIKARKQYAINYLDECNLQRNEIPPFYADGPYGTPMQDVFRYSVSVCVAGGIGITPYAAVLNMIK